MTTVQPDKWRVPFTPAQVVALNEYQRGPVHPYTCGVDSNHPPLVATEGGWHCEAKRPWCDYEQDWAHALPVTLRHHLIAADLVSHKATDTDGCPSIFMHSREEAADRALAAITAAGYWIVPAGASTHLMIGGPVRNREFSVELEDPEPANG